MRFHPEPGSTVVPGSFARPAIGARFEPHSELEGLELSGGRAWQSNGGPGRGHPARACAYTLETPLREDAGPLARIFVVGVFARWCSQEQETPGTVGAAVHLLAGSEVLLARPLINGKHYVDAELLSVGDRLNGDGVGLEAVGSVVVDGAECRVDVLTLDVPPDIEPSRFRFKDLGTPASFLLFDVLFEHRAAKGCPFHSQAGRVALEEVAGIVRTGNRVRLQEALAQLTRGLESAEDLDEARGLALTFLAVVTAAMLEAGGPRSLHRTQLEAARAFEGLSNVAAIACEAAARVREIVAPMVEGPDGPSGKLVDRALAIIERRFATDLSDEDVAAQLGLSTSHFRHVFRQATGQPFHRYLVSVRLERAQRMLLEDDATVSEIAESVGFAGLPQFSRAFSARFGTSPSRVRRTR